MPRKPACQTKRRPPQVFIGSGYQTGYFHLPGLSIGQKTELSLLRVFVELLQLHFHKCCLPLESLQVASHPKCDHFGEKNILP